VSRSLSAVPELPVVRVPVLEGDALRGASAPGASVSSWVPVEVPRGRRASPIFLATLGILAGIGSMALGTAAVISAGTSASEDAPVATPRAASAPSGVERRALAFLAEPRTDWIPFTSSGGRLLLAVAGDGRAAILSRGLGHAAVQKPYYAWAVRPGARPVRVARFVGSQRVVLLPVRLGPRASVIVSTDPSTGVRPTSARIVARRG